MRISGYSPKLTMTDRQQDRKNNFIGSQFTLCPKTETNNENQKIENGIQKMKEEKI